VLDHGDRQFDPGHLADRGAPQARALTAISQRISPWSVTIAAMRPFACLNP